MMLFILSPFRAMGPCSPGIYTYLHLAAPLLLAQFMVTFLPAYSALQK
jgi:hypothetical protein